MTTTCSITTARRAARKLALLSGEIDAETYRRFAAAARANDRSISAELRVAARAHLDRVDAAAAPNDAGAVAA